MCLCALLLQFISTVLNEPLKAPGGDLGLSDQFLALEIGFVPCVKWVSYCDDDWQDGCYQLTRLGKNWTGGWIKRAHVLNSGIWVEFEAVLGSILYLRICFNVVTGKL